jgi:hypothetical protein
MDAAARNRKIDDASNLSPEIFFAMLETYGFYSILAGIGLLAVGYLWLLVRAFHTAPKSRAAWLLFPPAALVYVPRNFASVRGPALLLLAACLLIGLPYAASYYERHFVPLKPYEQIVDGELRITLTGLKDFDYAVIAGRRDVVVLQMANADVDDRTLEHLRGLGKLRKLDLGDTKITDAGLAVVAGLPALEELYLSRTAITDEGFQRHLAAKESLAKIDFTGTAVKSKTMRDWKKLQPDRRAAVN